MPSFKTRLGRISGKLGIGLVSLLVSMIAVEIVIRIVLPQPFTEASPGLFELDPPRRYRMTAGYQGRLSNQAGFDTIVSTNSHRIRGPELDSSNPDPFRIMVVGDSFTFGWGVEDDETYVALLGPLLKDIPNVEMINAGVPGFGLQDELEWFQEYGLDLEPDLVLLGIFAGNDLGDATELGRREAIALDDPGPGYARGLWPLLYRNSHLIRLVDKAGVRTLLGMPEPWSLHYLRGVIRCHNDGDDPMAQEAHVAVRKALTGFADLADQHGFDLAAALLPGHFQIDRDRWQMMVVKLGLADASYIYDPESPVRFFLGSLGELGVPTLDLSPIFREAVREDSSLYFGFDPHWTPAGHVLAAREIRDFLLHDVIPAEPPETLSEEEESEPPAAD